MSPAMMWLSGLLYGLVIGAGAGMALTERPRRRRPMAEDRRNRTDEAGN